MSALFEKLLRPLLFRLEAETAHELGIKALQVGLASETAQRAAVKRFSGPDFGDLERFGLKFRNPLGVAAGFDKNGMAVNQLAALGFGSVEVGTVTFGPQKGNEKPRLFRLPKDTALINRLGFNNEGAQKIVERLKAIEPKCVLGVNIGKNRDVSIEEATENYLKSFELVHPVADYIAVNVSSPNTPNLRELQRSENLEELLGALQSRNRELSLEYPLQRAPFESEPPESGTPKIKPLLVKIAPDLSEGEIETIVDVALGYDLAGIIATNTTIKREELKTDARVIETIAAGGLSGRPLAARSNHVISTIYRLSKGMLPIVGVGGIFTAEDAFDKITAGASLVQAYTGFIYKGPSFAYDVNIGLGSILERKGFATLDDAVGSAAYNYGA